MMRGVIAVNDEQRERMIRKVQRAAGSDDLTGVSVGVLGLTFKAGTDDLRDSPSIAIIGRLRELGASVTAFDPTTATAVSPARLRQLEGIELAEDVDGAIRDKDVVVLLTEWPEFRSLDPHRVASLMRGRSVVDTRNLLDPASFRSAGLHYDGVGRPQ
jgi:UDPglucose 6-dehydrogenase